MDAAASKLAALGLPKLNTYAHSKGGRGGSRPGQHAHGGGGRGGFGARPRSASEEHTGGKPQRRRTLERKLARSKGTNRMVDASSGAMMGRAAALLGAKAKLKVKLASEGGAAVAPLTAEELAAASAPKKKKQKLAPVVKKAQLLPSASGSSEPLPDFLRALGMGAGARDANGEAAWDLDEEMRYFEQQLGIRREKKKNKAAAKAAADKAARANDPRASAPSTDGNDSDDAELDVNALSRFRKELDEDGLGDLFDFCDLLESGKETGARDEEEEQGFDMNDPDNRDDQDEAAAPTCAASAASSSKSSKSAKASKSAVASAVDSGYSASRKAEILAREAAIDAKQDAMEKALEKAMAKQAARDAKVKAARAAGLPIPAEEPDSDDDEEGEEEGDMVDERSGDDEEEEDDDNMTAAAIAHAAAVSRKRRRGASEDDEEEAEDAEDDDQDEDDDEDGEEDDADGDEELEDAEDAAEDDDDASDAETPAEPAAAADGKKKPSIPDLYGFSAPVPDSLLAFRRGDKNILGASGAAGAAAGAGASTAAAGSVGATAAPAAPAKYVPPHLRAQMAAAAAASAPAASPAAAAAAAVSSTSNASAMLALRRQLKGLLNRLTSANLEHIALQMTSTLYASHPKREVTELLCDELLGLCTLESEGTSGGYALGSNSSTLLASAALVVYLHSTLGSDIGAHFLERFVLAFVSFSRATAAAAESGKPPSAHAIKACTTLVTFLTYLYNFSLIGSGLIYDLLRQFLQEFRPDSIESVLVILQNCGYQLRKEEPAILKEIVLLIQERAKRYNHQQAVATKTKGNSAAAAPAAAASSSSAAAAAVPSSSEIPEGRVAFMLDMIYDLKNNKKRHSALYDSILPLQSWLSGKLKRKASAKGSSSSVIGENQLRFGMEDIVNIPTRGRWWIVGAAWKGKRIGENDDGAAAAASAHTPSAGSAAAKKSKSIILPSEDPSESIDLLSLARSQHMHTDLRKSLFLVIMSSVDYMDCYEKLSKLNLPPTQLRQAVKVLIDCCAQESTWNPYYALVLLQLSRMDGGKEIKFTAQLGLWDAVKEWSAIEQSKAMKTAGVKGESMKANWGKAKQKQVLHTAKLISLLLREPAGGTASGGGGGLPLTALKCFDFHALSALQLLFLTACLKDFMMMSDSAHIAASCLRLHTALVDPKTAGTSRAADAKLLRDGLDFFLHHHLTPTAQAMKDREAAKIMMQRIASARKALAGEVDADWMFKK